MKLFKYWLPTVMVAVTLSASVSASSYKRGEVNDELDERDYEAVTEFVNSKRTIPLQEKACNLSLAGDIRAEWHHYVEKVNGEKRRGHARLGDGTTATNGTRAGSNDFDVELNLHIDYKCDRSWGVAHIEFDNDMGITDPKYCATQADAAPTLAGTSYQTFCDRCAHGSGTCDCLCLRKAYLGYNVCADGCSRFDIEIGRRRLYDVFDSRVQFQSFFDGTLLRYATQLDCCADAYVNVGLFVVDSHAHHLGWAIEGGLLNICDSGFDVKYSYIDWEKNGDNRCFERHALGTQYQVHQFTGYYHFCPEVLCMPAKAYGAVLWNADAPRTLYTNNKRENLGWYIGAIFGEVCCEGDWSVDINYQYVEAQAVPDHDVSGNGRGNIRNECLYMLGAPATAVAATARGNANFQGWRVEGLYALTDNLSLDASFVYSRAADKGIGGSLNYSKWKLAAIYAF